MESNFSPNFPLQVHVLGLIVFPTGMFQFFIAFYFCAGVLWLWTAMLTCELALLTYKQCLEHASFGRTTRLFELAIMSIFLTLWMWVRTVNLAVHFFHPMWSRLFMLVGLLYFYMRAIGLFFPLSRTLGVLLVKVRVMVATGFTSFVKLVLPFFLAYMIVIQVVLYPDMPPSGEALHMAFDRAFFAMFLTPIKELREPEQCAASRFPTLENRTTSELCLSGMYRDTNVRLWAA